MPFIRKSSPTSLPSIQIGGPESNNFLRGTVIVNSGVMSVGDVLGVVSGAGVANSVVVRRYNGAGNAILGVCAGFGRANGKTVAFDSGSATTVTVGSDNETVARIYAIVDITPGAVWSVNSSAALHTTAVFGLGAWTDPDTGANAGRLAEASVTRTTVQGRGVACLSPDQDDTARGLVTIEETVFKAGLGA